MDSCGVFNTTGRVSVNFTYASLTGSTQIHLAVEYDFILRQGDRIDSAAEVFSNASY